jgi:hypothetical protein
MIPEPSEILIIEPEEVFRVWKVPAAHVRGLLEKLESSIEEQRLLAWVKWCAKPSDEEARKVYVGLCREQGRLMTAFNRWRARNPEGEE